MRGKKRGEDEKEGKSGVYLDAIIPRGGGGFSFSDEAWLRGFGNLGSEVRG